MANRVETRIARPPIAAIPCGSRSAKSYRRTGSDATGRDRRGSVDERLLPAGCGEVAVAEGGGAAEVRRAAATRGGRRHVLGDGARGRRIFAAASTGDAEH